MVPRPEPPDRPRAPGPREAVQRWRLTFRREPIDPADVGRTQQRAWEEALARSGLPLAGLDAPTPRPRFAMAAPLGAAVHGEAELVDVWLTERLARWRVRAALSAVMPPASTLIDLHDIWLGEAALPGQVVASVYRVRLELGPTDVDRASNAIDAIEAAPALPRRRVKGERGIDYDLRPMIEQLTLRPEDAGTADAGALAAPGPPGPGVELVMILRHDPEKGVGRPDEVLAELGERLGAPVISGPLTRVGLILASDRPPGPGAAGRTEQHAKGRRPDPAR